MNTLSMKKAALYCSMASFASLLISIGTNIFMMITVPILIIHILITTAVIYKVRESKLWKHLLYSALLTVALFYAFISGSLSYIDTTYVNVVIAVISCTPLFVLYFKSKEYKNELLIITITNILGNILYCFIFTFKFSYYSINLGLYVMFAFLICFLYISSKETEDKNTKYASFAGIIGIALFFVFGIVNIIYVYCDKPEYYDSIYDILYNEDKAQFPTLAFVEKLIDIQQYILPLASIALASFFFVLLKRSGWVLKKECVPIIINTLSLFFFIQQSIYDNVHTFATAIFAIFSYSFYKLYQKL